MRTLQQKAGVPFSGRELGLVKDLYLKRQANGGNKAALDQLQTVADALSALEVDIAEAMLKQI